MYDELKNLCIKYYNILELLWLCNWCGASKGFSFDTFLFWLLEAQSYYDKDKWKILYEQIRIEWCFVHDLMYGLKMSKLYADFKLAKYIWGKTYWTSLWLRITIFAGVFLWLTLKWWKAYKNAQKITYNQLIEEIQKNNIITEVP